MKVSILAGTKFGPRHDIAAFARRLEHFVPNDDNTIRTCRSRIVVAVLHAARTTTAGIRRRRGRSNEICRHAVNLVRRTVAGPCSAKTSCPLAIEIRTAATARTIHKQFAGNVRSKAFSTVTGFGVSTRQARRPCATATTASIFRICSTTAAKRSTGRTHTKNGRCIRADSRRCRIRCRTTASRAISCRDDFSGSFGRSRSASIATAIHDHNLVRIIGDR